MSILRHLVAVLCAFSPLVAGCAQGGPIEGEDVGEVSLADKNGSTGNNGMGWDDYKAAEADLIAAAEGGPLVDFGTMEVTQDIEGGLLSSEAGQNIFHYVVACTVPRGEVVGSSLGKTEGMGHLASGEAWLDRALSEKEVNDLLECMIAHINPLGKSVPILLSGASVNDDGLNHDDYWADEALWIAHVTSTGGAEYVVYPMDAVKEKCGPDPSQAFAVRLCGQNPTACVFVLGDTSTCTKTADGYECGGQRAIMTSLTTDGFDLMWASCYN